MKERLYERASLKGIELSPGEEEVILKELERWNRKLEYQGLVVTADHTYTLIDPHSGEPYHSLSAGALTESIEKFFKPSSLSQVALQGKVTILDVGFGLGYNSAVALREVRRLNPRAEIFIVALDRKPPADVPLLPDSYGEAQREILDLIPEGSFKGLYVKFLEGDIRATLPQLREMKFDTVFHDLFSPYKNSEGWTLEVFRMIREVLSPTGTWVSYTSSLPVRRALRELGFRLKSTKPVGRKRGGTVASFRGSERLSREEKEKIERSPYSVPFRDPNLNLEPIDILIDYRLNVLLRERVVSSGQRRESLPQPSL